MRTPLRLSASLSSIDDLLQLERHSDGDLSLVEQAGGLVAGVGVVIELKGLNGRECHPICVRVYCNIETMIETLPS